MPANRRVFTATFLEALKPAPKGQRYSVADLQTPGLKVRVNDKGEGTFLVWRRFGGAAHPTARALGSVRALTLKDARDKARTWVELSKAGKDPALIAAAQRAAEEVAQAAERAKTEGIFGEAVELYFKGIANQRQAAAVEGDIRRDLLPYWKFKPLAAITRQDVLTRIRAIRDGEPFADGRPRAKGSLYQAHAAFSNARSIFNWARDENYGLVAVPTDGMRPGKLIGQKKSRERVLSDLEICAFWQAAESLPSPLSPMLKLLLLTGARKSEICDAAWRELDFEKSLLTVPAERFKSNVTHVIPLVPEALELFEGMSRWKNNPYVFTHGSLDADGNPISANISNQNKQLLDKTMLTIMREIAAANGEDEDDVTLPSFTIHDVRRTVRTRLSALRVTDTVAELVIGHTLKGLHKVYDRHAYLDEKREALALWAAELKRITRAEKSHTNSSS